MAFDHPRRMFTEGDVIFQEGESGDHAYMLERGSVELSKASSTVGLRVVAEIVATPGKLFGLLPLIDDGPRLVTATALEETVCVIISREQFAKRLTQSQPFIRDIVHILTYRLRQMADHIASRAVLRKDEAMPALSLEETQKLPLDGIGRQSFSKGDVIYREGQESDRAYILESGRVELSKSSIHARVVAEVVGRPGMFFGILPLVDGGPHVASARVIEDATCLVVDRPSFERRFVESDPVVRSVVKLLSARLREMSRRLADGGVVDRRR